MNHYNLTTHDFLNPYYIKGKKVAAIHFYDDTGLIATHERGWFTNDEYEKVAVKEIEKLDFVAPRKLDLTKKRHFLMPSDHEYEAQAELYIYTPELKEMKIELLGELIALKTKTETYYGKFIKITATFGNDKEWKRDTIEMMVGRYSKSVKTPLGTQVDAFKNLLAEYGIAKDCINTHHVEEAIQTETFRDRLTCILSSEQ